LPADHLGPGPEFGSFPATAELVEETGVVLETDYQKRSLPSCAWMPSRRLWRAPVDSTVD
jgi:hypothetical protein